MRNRKATSDQTDLNNTPLNPHDKAILAIAKCHFNDGGGDGIDAVTALNDMLSYMVAGDAGAGLMDTGDYRRVLVQYTRTVTFILRMHVHTAWHIEESSKGGMTTDLKADRARDDDPGLFYLHRTLIANIVNLLLLRLQIRK